MENKINFIKANIDALPIPDSGKRYTYHDTKTAGLQIRITSTGVKTFSVYRRIKGGDPERITIGRYPDMTIEQARREAVRIAADISDGKNPAEIKRGKKAELTFSDLFAEYLERHSKPSKRTWREDESKYKTYLEKTLGRKKLSSIDRRDIALIHSSITKVGHDITANRVLALTSSIFGWGISAGLWELNPAIGVKRNKENTRDRFIQGDELPRFFEAVAKEENDAIRDYVLISLLTGARRANVLSMRWQNINFDRAEWRIEETKNGTPQTVTLSQEAIEILQARKPSNHAIFVFPGSGKSGHLEEPKKGWKRILERAGIQNLRIHDLRRTLGSWQAKTGASLAIIGKSLNHKNQNTTAIYARLDLDPVRDSVNKATSAMLTAAGLKQSARPVPLKRSKGS
ncbi:tyrosine-type recombinase/integrase [Nitrosomonas ureae]|uniref:Site-specific recombinase XerD n=1 Tax=Nitrosomonas ureae TaxID=44577 RepID=A0A1H9A5S4_9PROT|nr:site-specific integrase [Nitrosomonas ureae]SEP71833.1 Site-specific recombinase XerD [Nitrosomonas ureae]